MPFRIGLSGLNAAQADLKITGNNIANVSTIGFKQSRAEFADVYASSKFGSVSTAIGSGVRLAAASQQFTQGNIIFTENNLDLGITGDGFFSLADVSGNQVYTRNGQFKVDKDGFIVDNSNSNLKGYGIDPNTNDINTGSIVNLQINSTNIAPNATTDATLVANIDSGEVAPDDIADPWSIDPATGVVDPDSYNHTTSFTSYDSLGNALLTSLYFRKTVNPNEWQVATKLIDAQGNIFNTIDNTGVTGAPGTQTIEFDSSGNLTAPVGGTFSLTFDLSGAVPASGAADSTIAFDLSDLTQYGANFGVTNLTQNGYTTGQLSGIDVDQSGVISARFTNGQSNNLGQVYLTSFTNSQGLSQLGDNYWAESFSSGQGIINAPGEGNAGLINSGALEDSNVDLTEQLINLITAQRNFQANAKTITTADTITQTVIQL
ncbi:MAG: flagellar hook-basal body complex protein [Gammaproteobacteria bacterium]|nr:flagellar hook-basal body complex protein [Gammaproteobacteria bacterium]